MADADDVIKEAGRLFSKLGGTLKQVGGEVKDKAKQVTGIGRGHVRVEIEQIRVAPGGTIRGRAILALPEAVTAKRLVVVLRARQKVMTIANTSGRKSVGTQYTEVYQFERALGDAMSYESGEHAFELHVPSDALDLRPASAGASPLADAVRSVASAFSPRNGPIEWDVTAKLEIAWGRDLSRSVDIVIS